MNSSWLSENLLKKQQQKSMSGGGVNKQNAL